MEIVLEEDNTILTISYMFQQHGPSGAKVTINPGYMTATIKIKK